MNKYTKALEFNDDKHEYRVNGKVIPSVTELCGPLTYSKYRVDNAVIEQAAYRGSLIHELTALWDRGDLEEDGVLAPDVGLYLMAWIQFCRDYRPKWEFIELPLACRKFAGTIDRIGEIDGRLVVVDIKTTSSMDRANKVALAIQLFGYNELCHSNGIMEDNGSDVSYWNSLGVQLKKDGTYTVHLVDNIVQKYGIDVVSTFSWLEKINTLTKGERFVE